MYQLMIAPASLAWLQKNYIDPPLYKMVIAEKVVVDTRRGRQNRGRKEQLTVTGSVHIPEVERFPIAFSPTLAASHLYGRFTRVGAVPPAK